MYIRRIVETPGCQEKCHVLGLEGGFGIEKKTKATLAYIAHLDNS